jgi:RimJ/RimL family protein N-acetyltransferase
MYSFEIESDIEIIKKVITSDNNRAWSFEDGQVPEGWQPRMDGILYIANYRHDVFAGLIGLVEISIDTVEAHVLYLPSVYGHAVETGKHCMEWIWKNTEYRKLMAPVVDNNELAHRFLAKLGFTKIGTIEKKWKKD